jgi:pectinesterase
MKFIFPAAILILILVLSARFAEPAEKGKKDTSGFTLHKGLVFTEGKTPLKLDLYIPENQSKPVPCIMVIQGGGFKPQNGSRFRPFAEKFAKAGFAAALISYRGRPKNNYIDTMADVKASVRFIRSVSSKYKINPDKIGSMGRSAGGTISVLLGVSGEVKELEGKRGHAKYSSRIQASIGLAGVYDFIGRVTDKEQTAQVSNVDTKKATNGEWIGAPFSEKNEHWLRAAAINHIDKNDPPIILFHCKNDGTVPWQQSRDMFEKLKTIKNGSELKLFDKGGHGVGVKRLDKMMIDFFNKTLNGKPASSNRKKG